MITTFRRYGVNIITKRIFNFFCQSARLPDIDDSISTDNIPYIKQKEKPPQKAYLKLFKGLQLFVKVPSQSFLKIIKSRGITTLMTNNHTSQNPQLLFAHIQCLYCMIKRIQPSVESMSLFIQCLLRQFKQLRQEGINTPAFVMLYQTDMLKKIVKIAHGIDSFYNQAFRCMVATLLIKFVNKSKNSKYDQGIKLQQLQMTIDQHRINQTLPIDQQGNSLSLQQYRSEQLKALNEAYPILGQLDYWAGCEYALSFGYYQTFFIKHIMRELENPDHVKTTKPEQLKLLCYRLKTIKHLVRLTSKQPVSALPRLRQLFSKYFQQYIRILQTQKNLFDLINDQDWTIQTSLLTQFDPELANTQMFLQAKKTYMAVFMSILQYMHTGCLHLNIKRLKGIFQVILLMFNYQDTKQVHVFLAQLERVLILYPLQKFDNLEVHCLLCEKYGYSSDYITQKFYKHLMDQKQRLDRNRLHLHKVHEVYRDLQLARKLLICAKMLSIRQLVQQTQHCQQLASQLFDQSIWHTLQPSNIDLFLNGFSFDNQLHFIRSQAQHWLSNKYHRSYIQQISSKTQIKNLSNDYFTILQSLKQKVNSFTTKITHTTHWRQNPHARLVTTIQLGINHYHQLKKNSAEQANNFLKKFVEKILNVQKFNILIKDRIAYPELIKVIDELIDLNPEAYSTQSKQMQKLKSLLGSLMIQSLKTDPPITNPLYQKYIDFIQYNQIFMPFIQPPYDSQKIQSNINSDIVLWFLRRYTSQKQFIRKQIYSYQKYNRSNEDISVSTNHLQYPYVGDVRIRISTKKIMVLFSMQQSQGIINKNVEMAIKEGERYWRQRKYKVIVLRGQKDIDSFIDKHIKNN